MMPDSLLTLDYSSTRRPFLRRPGIVIGVLITVVATIALWIAQQPKDYLDAKQPLKGDYVWRDGSGKSLQKTVWRNGKLVSGWEFTTASRWVDGRFIVDPPAWTQVVKSGSGWLSMFNRQGEAVGGEFYILGNYDHGAH